MNKENIIDNLLESSTLEEKTYTQKISEGTKTSLSSHIIEYAIIPSLDENHKLTEKVYDNLMTFLDQCICSTVVRTVNGKMLQSTTRIQFVDLDKQSGKNEKGENILNDAILHGQKIASKLFVKEAKENFISFSAKTLKDLAHQVEQSHMDPKDLLAFLENNIMDLKEKHKQNFEEFTEDK